MNPSSIPDFNLICRVCLTSELALKSLLQSEAADMLNFCQFMKVHETDKLPTHICLECDKTLQECYAFKQKCDTSNKTLKKLLKLVDGDQINNTKIEIAETTFICGKCQETFTSEDLLQEHVLTVVHRDLNSNSNKLLETEETNDNDKVHYGESKYIQNNSEDDLTSFLEVKSVTLLPYTCSQCTQSFIEEEDLDLHRSTHTSGDLLCVVCNKTFRNRQMLTRHIKTHMIHKPHICQKSGKGFAESHSLTKHMRTHMGIPREKRHFCEACGQGFSEPYYLKVHKRKHTGERPLICNICDKSFADPRSLKAHNFMHSDEKPYKCHICPKAFSQSANLTKHIRVHTGEKPYVCPLCGKCFTQSSSLDKHHRIHTGEKPFACDNCPRRFAEKGTLIHHKRTHTGEKPYVCEVCGNSFASSSELKLHDRKHSGIKRNICNVCGKDFATPSNLLVHTRAHTGEKPFQCTICAKKFADKGTLNKHGTLVHPTNENVI